MNTNPPTTAPSITIKDAHLDFDDEVIFSNLNITFAAEKCSCILGGSGVGKTSLLRLIAGLTNTVTSETGDEVVFANDNQPLTNRIAYMAQSDLTMPWLSVLDNVLLAQRLSPDKQDIKFAKQKALQILDSVGLAKEAKKLPSQLSGGMKQRVALARTLMQDKPVVLMDEPFSALDVITRHAIQALAAELLQNRTVILVTHDPLEALRVGHDVYVLSGKPANLNKVVELTGDPVRDLHSPQITELHITLLEHLADSVEVLE